MIRPLLLFLICIRAGAATWYASGTGTETNGTYGQPWSPRYAVTNGNPHLAAGDTVIFKSGGSWQCVETNTGYSVGEVLEFRKSGGTGNPITYQPESLWGFTFDGGLLFTSDVSNLVVQKFTITYSQSTNRNKTVIYTHPPGVFHQGQNVSLLHNLIDNAGHTAIQTWNTTRGKTIKGNILRFCGMRDYVDYAGTPRGGGMYAQNLSNSNPAVVMGQISYYNYTDGLAASGNQNIWDFQFTRNIIAEADQGGIFGQQDDSGFHKIIIASNYIWKGNPAIRIGYIGNGPHSNAIVHGNYAVDDVPPAFVRDGWQNMSWQNNVIVNLTNRYVWNLEQSGETHGDITSHTNSGNVYYSSNSGSIGSGPFQIKEVTKSLAQWQSETTEDADAVHSYVFPAVTTNYVFRPSDDTNFVHVAVFNWGLSNSISISLSGFFQSGATIDTYDVQNIPTKYKREVYSGGDVSLDLTLTNRAPILGELTERSYGWDGFDPQFRAFVIHQVTDPVIDPSPGKSKPRGRPRP